MPSVRRTGLTKIRNLALLLCTTIGAFEPLIKRVYPNSTALHVALEAVNVACAELVLRADAVLPDGD